MAAGLHPRRGPHSLGGLNLGRGLKLGRGLTAFLTAGLAIGLAARAEAGAIAFDRPELQSSTSIEVTIPAVAAGGLMPTNYTADGRNVSPPVSWTAGPPTTRSFVVLMQDADAPGPQAAVHWLAYAIPPAVLSLPRGMKNVISPTNPLGSAQGRNYHDSFGYSGPRPPPGDAAHHYHLQVFALDRPVRTPPGAELPAVLRAMAGHVVARGELVATYVSPPPGAAHGKTKGAGAAAGPPS